MHVYGPSSVHAPHAIRSPQQLPTAAPSGDLAAPQDELQLSDAARLIDQVNAMPGVRLDRVREIQSQIASGVYETDAKLDAALDRLLDEIA